MGSGRVKPNPTVAPPPACDSCCPTPPPVDEDKIACAALDKRLVVLEDALRDHECKAENADDETMELCAQLTFEATPLCMNASVNYNTSLEINLSLSQKSGT